jgi:hypothetical protein
MGLGKRKKKKKHKDIVWMYIRDAETRKRLKVCGAKL